MILIIFIISLITTEKRISAIAKSYACQRYIFSCINYYKYRSGNRDVTLILHTGLYVFVIANVTSKNQIFRDEPVTSYLCKDLYGLVFIHPHSFSPICFQSFKRTKFKAPHISAGNFHRFQMRYRLKCASLLF